MKKFVIPSAVLAAAVLLIVLLTYSVSNHADTGSLDAKVARGQSPVIPGYDAALPVLGANHTADLASFKHKLLVVNIYASWCTDCKVESPLVRRTQAVLARHDATFVGITYEDASSSTEGFDRRYDLHYPVLRDVNGTLVHDFGTYAVPETFVINRTGHIMAIRRTVLTQQWINQTLMPIVRAQT